MAATERIMKLVYLNPSAQLGGAEAALHTVMASIRKRYPEWSLELIVTEKGPLISRAEAIGARVTVVPLPSGIEKLGDSAAGGPQGGESGGQA